MAVPSQLCLRAAGSMGMMKLRRQRWEHRALQVTPVHNGGLRIYLNIAISAKAYSVLSFKSNDQTEEQENTRAFHNGSEFAGSQILH